MTYNHRVSSRKSSTSCDGTSWSECRCFLWRIPDMADPRHGRYLENNHFIIFYGNEVIANKLWCLW